MRNGKRNRKEWREAGGSACTVILEAALLFLMGAILWENGKLPQKSAVETTADGYIKWVDFNVSYEALSRAYEYDISSYGEKQHLDWIDLLAYVGAKNGGDFGAGATEDMRTAAEKKFSAGRIRWSI